jgi:hypothetical protein
MLLIGGALVATGMIIMGVGSNLTTQGMTKTEGLLKSGSPIEITKELDPAIKSVGAFIVLVQSFEEGKLKAVVIDPNGGQVASKTIDQISTEEQFKITIKGTYKLILENSGEEISAMIGLTHMPEKAILGLNVLGFWITVSGFVGLVVAMMYMIKDRKKSV